MKYDNGLDQNDSELLNNHTDPMPIKILRKLIEDKSGGSQEVYMNPFLQACHADLGTIRRTIVDLIQLNLIGFSNYDNEDAIKLLMDELDSNKRRSHNIAEQEQKDAKNSLRLLKSVGDQSRTPPIPLHIRVNGIRFLLDYDSNIKNSILIDNQNQLTRFQVKSWYWPHILSLLSLLVAILAITTNKYTM